MIYKIYRKKCINALLSIFIVDYIDFLYYNMYVEKVFPVGSNLEAFAQLFDIVSSVSFPEGPGFLQMVFGKTNLADLDSFPQKTGLQKSVIPYLTAGGDFGRGYGILLYDGKKKEIINKVVGPCT